MASANLDQAKAEAFAERLVGVMNGGALALMTSIGHRTGLFDTMAEMAASTSQEIADKAGLNERYVREWLGAMVTGGFVEYNRETKKYKLPAEHAASLTRAATPDNIAAFTQYIPLLGSVEDKIVECFKNGGGIDYADFPRFQSVMMEDSGQTVVAALTDYIIPLVSGLEDRLKQGIDVLDVGCGSGRAINKMAKAFPSSRFTGYDISEEAIERARAEAKEMGNENVTFAIKDATTFDETDAYDLICTFDAIHDQADPQKVLENIRRALKPDGTYLMQDIKASSEVANNTDHPIGPMLYTLSCMHCMTVSLAKNGQGLGAMWGREQAQDLLKKAGFTSVDIKTLDHDFQNDYYIIKKS